MNDRRVGRPRAHTAARGALDDRRGTCDCAGASPIVEAPPSVPARFGACDCAARALPCAARRSAEGAPMRTSSSSSATRAYRSVRGSARSDVPHASPVRSRTRQRSPKRSVAARARSSLRRRRRRRPHFGRRPRRSARAARRRAAGWSHCFVRDRTLHNYLFRQYNGCDYSSAESTFSCTYQIFFPCT